MNTYFTKTALAAGLLAALSASAAHAQFVPLTAAPSPATATTAQYPVNDGFITGSFQSAFDTTGNVATFTATGATSATVHSFETFINSVVNGNTGGGLSLDFPVDSVEVNTFDGGEGKVPGATGLPTGPLNISFDSAVSSFGLNVESARTGTSTFSFFAYDGAVAPQNLIGSFTYAPVTQTANAPKSIFIGAEVFGPNKISNIVISSVSDTNNSTPADNDFYFGSLKSYDSPVPEASTTVSLGLLLMLGVGGAAFSARRKAANAGDA